MCTVSYLPLKQGCLITSNRDEASERLSALPPQVYESNGKSLLFPKDPVGGGTWIASSRDAAVCLFNGAFKPHVRKPSYRISRGLVPVSFFRYDTIEAFIKDFDFVGIEPFSLVIYHQKRLVELKWDETTLHRFDHDPLQAHIWASATLYSPEVVAERKRWFSAWLANSPAYNIENVMRFHSSRLGDKENGLFIDRKNGLKTVSVSSIQFSEEQETRLTYHDLKRNMLNTISL